MSWDINSLYFFSWNFIYFQQKEPIKVQIWWNFTWAVERLKFCTLMGFFCPTHIKFLPKKYRRIVSHKHWRVMQSLKKKQIVVSNMTWRIWWVFTQPLESLKIYFRWALNTRNYKLIGVIFHDTEQWCNVWINPDLVVSKAAWGWWWWWWWIVFVVWLTDERRLALFSAGTIVRDPHHRESPTRREQGLSLRRTWFQA